MMFAVPAFLPRPWALILLVCLSLGLAVPAYALNPHLEDTAPITTAQSSQIVVNQAGYLPEAGKFALLLDGADEPLELVHEPSATVMATLPLVREMNLANGLRVNWVDFSAISLDGEYFLRQGKVQSNHFRIGRGVYDFTSWLLQRSYYLQRCGVALEDALTGIQHAACHTLDGVYAHTDEVNQQGDPHPAAGGWHDAGDFGKYMATASVTVSRLLSLYLMQPDRYTDKALSIPESGNGISDLLDEVKFELDWMLKMQRMDGAVYRKLSGTEWVSARVPEQDTDTRLIYGVSSPETAKFAASMAVAARAYRIALPLEADVYRAAAERAWLWLEKNPAMTFEWYAGDDSGSGAYKGSFTDVETTLEFDDDDRLAAAIELYLTTGEAKYRDFFQAEVERGIPYTLYEWKDATALPLWHLLTYDQSVGLAAARTRIRQNLLARADSLLDNIAACPFGLANQRFVWGSNKMAAEEGITLLHAWKYTGDPHYLQGALWQVDYLFGRNPFGLSFVTGSTPNAVKKPLHLFGTALGRTIPGLLVGGANSLAQDKIAPANQRMFSYVDDNRAYSVNEYAIDYNASLIALLEVLGIYQAGQTRPESGKGL